MSRDGTLRGALSGERGRASVTGGWVSGNRFSFAVRVSAGRRVATWVYTGTVEGRLMRGVVTVGRRPLDFTGIRQSSSQRDRKPTRRPR